jgi:lipoprotein-anchoring transpeptidase ErfK/SrfK
VRLTSAGRIVIGVLLTAGLLGGWLVLRQTAPTAPARAGQRVQLIVPQNGTRTLVRQPHQTNLRSPCTSNTSGQLIVVSIRHQHLWSCAGHRTVLSTPVTTGATSRPGDATPHGSFAVQGIERHVTLTTDGPKSYPVRYWIPFHLGTWGFHDAAWQTIPFGSKSYVTRGSHGCVHLPLAAVRSLFHWVHYGTVVRVH